MGSGQLHFCWHHALANERAQLPTHSNAITARTSAFCITKGRTITKQAHRSTHTHAGHDLIPDTIGGFTVKDIFSGERFFGITSNGGSEDPDKANADLNELFGDVARSPAGALDGHASDALRDFLFGMVRFVHLMPAQCCMTYTFAVV